MTKTISNAYMAVTVTVNMTTVVTLTIIDLFYYD